LNPVLNFAEFRVGHNQPINVTPRCPKADIDIAGFYATYKDRKCLTDPAGSWTAIASLAIFAYSTNYLVNVKASIIVDVEPSSLAKNAPSTATAAALPKMSRPTQCRI